MVLRHWSYGDSFTEGYGDFYPDGSCQGWADRFARLLAASAILHMFNGTELLDPGLVLINLIRCDCLDPEGMTTISDVSAPAP